jgi:ATP-dependent protease ClpP protease subunit
VAKKNKILLTEQNLIILSGMVTPHMAAYFSKQLQEKDKLLPAKQPIYVFINSGGGFVSSGIDIINMMSSTTRPIITISSFAFSMAFSISQRGTSRYVLKLGTMGQHRARASIEGYLNDGELESRLDYLRQMMIILEEEEASILKLSYQEYKKLISTEWYGVGKEAVKRGMASSVVEVECSASLKETKTSSFDISIFGSIEISSINGCPLL